MKHLRELYTYFLFFKKYIGVQFHIYVFVFFIVGFIEVVGIALFAPLFSTFGSSDQEPDKITIYFNEFLKWLDLSQDLTTTLLVIVTVFCLKAVVLYSAEVYGFQILGRFSSRIRKNIINSISSMNYDFYLSQNTGDLTNIVTTETGRTINAFKKYIHYIAETINLFVMIIAITYLGFEALILISILGIVYMILTKRLLMRSKKLSTGVTKHNGKLQNSIIQMLQSYKYLKTTNRFDQIKVTKNIKTINLSPGEITHISATAEFSLALLLSLVRKIPFIDPNLTTDRQIYRGMQLRGKRIGIFGFGRLGKKMARYAEALDMEWVSFDKNDTEKHKKSLLETSDIISIHLPLCKDTVDFFDTQEFSTMLKKPFIINTSRPQLINKKALINSLNNNTISGLAMDFISYNADNKWDADLRKYSGSKLLLTPHIAGNTYESVSEASEVVVDKFHSLV